MRALLLASLFTGCCVAVSIFFFVKYLRSRNNQSKEVGKKEAKAASNRLAASDEYYTFGLIREDSLVFPKLHVSVKLSDLNDALQQMTCPSKKVVNFTDEIPLKSDGSETGFARRLKKHVDDACGEVLVHQISTKTDSYKLKSAEYSFRDRQFFITCLVRSKDTKTDHQVMFDLKNKGYVYVNGKPVIRHMKKYESKLPDTRQFCKKEVRALLNVVGDPFIYK
jgi:hypothetical protein